MFNTKLETRALMYLLRREREREMENQENCEFMEIKIKKDDAIELAGLIYLGNIVINGYKKTEEEISQYTALADDIYRQIIEVIPKNKLKYKFKNMPNEKSLDAKIADFRDKVGDFVDEYYEDFQAILFNEFIAEKSQ